jgi:hypothetical protein
LGFVHAARRRNFHFQKIRRPACSVASSTDISARRVTRRVGRGPDQLAFSFPDFPPVVVSFAFASQRARGNNTGVVMDRLQRWIRNTFRGLWLSPDFRKLWTSLTITAFGSQITNLALPLTAALLLHATPLQMGVLIALETLPFALVSLHANCRS